MHEAVGSMPAQPIKDRNTEEIITPVKEALVKETSDAEVGLASAAGDFTNKAVTNEAPSEEGMVEGGLADPNEESADGEMNEPSDDVPTESETSSEEGEKSEGEEVSEE